MTNVMYQDLTVKNTIDAGNIGSNLLAAIRDAICPVGSVVCSSTSPAGRIGGTWVQIEDVFILAAGSAYAEDSTGGEAAHTLTINEMPEHSHLERLNNTGNGQTWWCVVNNGYTAGSEDTNYNAGYTDISGNNQPHNNMPPYVAKKYWERTA